MMSSNVPTFFFSHTRQDREMRGNYLVRFYEDLTAAVGEVSGVDLQAEPLGTIDREVLQGEDWDRNLAGRVGADKAFVAIMTPLYFKREYCGKELYGFLLRSRRLGIDTDGALTDVENVLPIRWLAEEVYYDNGKKDARIPAWLRRVQDTPADPGGDARRTRAIQKYKKRGMKDCVASPNHYRVLLELFALRIRDMADLPPAAGLSFAKLKDAFKYDWKSHFRSAQAAPPAGPAAVPAVPRALTSVVVFYVTDRPLTYEPAAVSFADRLLTESCPGGGTPPDPAFNALLADVRAAGEEMHFTIFHAAGNPAVPAGPQPLLSRLVKLTKSGVMTALVVDPSVWPGGDYSSPGRAAVEQIIRSPDWAGPVLLPALSADADVDAADRLVKTLGVPARLFNLPHDSAARAAALHRAFSEARTRVLAASAPSTGSAADGPPLLQNVASEAA